MTVCHPRDIGDHVERVAAGRWPLSLPDEDPNTWDAIVEEDIDDVLEAGDRVEIKACVDRGASGKSGRWLIKRPTFDARLDEDSAFILGVYSFTGELELPTDAEVRRMEIVPANELDRIIDASGLQFSTFRHTQAIKIGWHHVFDSLEDGDGA